MGLQPIALPAKAGVPADADLTAGAAAADGMAALNKTTKMLWVRSGGGWVPVAPDSQQAGLLAPDVPYLTYAAMGPAANRAFFMRVVPRRAYAITKIAFVTTIAANQNDAVDAGIYDAAGNRLSSAGATTGKANAAAGVQQLTLGATVSLDPGTVYYAAFSYGAIGGTVANIAGNNVNGGVHQGFGTALGTIDAFFQNTSHPLPATVAVNTSTITQVPFLWLRET